MVIYNLLSLFCHKTEEYKEENLRMKDTFKNSIVASNVLLQLTKKILIFKKMNK